MSQSKSNEFLSLMVMSFAILALLIGFIVYTINNNVNTVEIDRYKEERVIEVLFTDAPKHFKIRYKDLGDGQVYREGSKHCGSFTEDKYQVGHKYRVTIDFKTTQYKQEEPVTTRLTSGCDLYKQQPQPL